MIRKSVNSYNKIKPSQSDAHSLNPQSSILNPFQDLKENKQSPPFLNQQSSRDIDGVLLLDKPIGISSNQALQKVRRLLHANKAGHTGNLDVLASGMLPICLGEATKFTRFLLDADKTYYAVAQLGKCTTTGDREGSVVEEHPTDSVTREMIDTVLAQFTKTIQQVPPMYSALKHQGTPLYKLARQGVEIDRKSRAVTIYSIALIDWERDRLAVKVHCSKGTYIRTLLEDIGKALGCGAYTLELRRLTAGAFREEQMVSLGELEAKAVEGLTHLNAELYPIEILTESLPIFYATPEEARKLRHGVKILLKNDFPTETFIRLYDETQQFFGVGTIEPPHHLTGCRLCRQP